MIRSTSGTHTTSLYPCGRSLLELPSPMSLVVLGVTGSIGTQTIDLVLRNPDRLNVAAVSCHSQVDKLIEILTQLKAAFPDLPAPLVAIGDASARERFAAEYHDLAVSDQLLASGPKGLVEAVQVPARLHCLVNGLVGAVGLEPTLAAAKRGLRIALANKESLVVGGDLVRQAVQQGKAEVLPVDSEHSAIAQCLSGRQPEEVAQLVLTASGGPFRETPAADLATVTLKQVLKHPTWDMGPKITVDSATLMNKGLEVIEAHHLFGLGYERIDVVVHPGSYVHSLVEFVDGALLAQLGTPDMRLPLLYAICGEKHLPLDGDRLDLKKVGQLNFEEPDLERFPCLRLAREAGVAGQGATIVLNAANEVAVAALLKGRIKYGDIPVVVEKSLLKEHITSIENLKTALAVDHKARATASAIIDALPEPGPKGN